MFLPFFKINYFQIFLSVSNRLDPDLDQHSVVISRQQKLALMIARKELTVCLLVSLQTV